MATKCQKCIILFINLILLSACVQTINKGPENVAKLEGTYVNLTCDRGSSATGGWYFIIDTLTSSGVGLVTGPPYDVGPGGQYTWLGINMTNDIAYTYRCSQFMPVFDDAFASVISIGQDLSCQNDPSVVAGDQFNVTCSATYSGNMAPTISCDTPDAPPVLSLANVTEPLWDIQTFNTSLVVSGTSYDYTYRENTMEVITTFDTISGSAQANIRCSLYFNSPAPTAATGSYATNFPTYTSEVTSSIDVWYPPENITIVTPDSTLPVDAAVTCWANANPSASYEWYEIAPGNRILSTTDTLTTDSSMEGERTYQCVASNTVAGTYYTDIASINITVVAVCAEAPCVHGTCTDLPFNYSCTCDQHYEGRNCTEEVDYCLSDPCMSGGTCVPQLGQYTCQCVAGYTGDHCETTIDFCDSSPCLNGATCEMHVNGYNCSCVPGYNNTHCENSECDSDPCSNGATCTAHAAGYDCACAEHYTGLTCQSEVDYCAASDPCQHGATCSPSLGLYTCSCLPGYTGVNCETMIDLCKPNPCMNGATCDPLPNQFVCTCAPGYSGPTCEASYCDSDPCQNTGTCTPISGAYRCDCPFGTLGDHCEIVVDMCSGNPCKNGATCEALIGRYVCHCAVDWTGTDCENYVSEGDSTMIIVGAVVLVVLLIILIIIILVVCKSKKSKAVAQPIQREDGGNMAQTPPAETGGKQGISKPIIVPNSGGKKFLFRPNKVNPMGLNAPRPKYDTHDDIRNTLFMLHTEPLDDPLLMLTETYPNLPPGLPPIRTNTNPSAFTHNHVEQVNEIPPGLPPIELPKTNNKSKLVLPPL